MKDVFQAIVALTVCFILVFVLSDIKRKLLHSLNTDENTSLFIAVRAEGEAKGLEQTLKAAEILQKESRMAAEIVIIDAGMAIGARKTAEIFVRENTLARIGQDTGEDLWKKPSTPE